MRVPGDRILIKPDAPVSESAGGVIIPEQAQRETSTGAVEKTGRDVHELDIIEGDRVVFSKYAGTAITLNDEDYVVCRPADILVIL